MTDMGKTLFERVAFVAVLLIVGYLVYLVLFPFLTPLVWAAVFAIVFRSIQLKLEARTGPTRAALGTTVVAALLIVAPAIFLLSVLVREMPQLIERLQQASTKAPTQVAGLWTRLTEHIPVALPDDPAQLLSQGIQRGLSWVAARAGSALSNLFSTIGSFFVFLFSLFFLLRDGHQLAALLVGLLPFRPDESRRLLNETRGLVVASVGAGLAVAGAQGAIGGVAFWLLGLGAPAVWGLVMAIAALIPLVGAAMVWVPAAAWLMLSGEVARGVALAAVGTLGISMVDNVLRPLLLSDKTSANGLVVFLGLLGGASAFGFVGLVIGPIILVTAGSILRIMTRTE